MGSRAETTTSSFSRQVVEAIKRLRVNAGMTNADLIAAAGFGNNKYYTCLRGDTDFDTSDLESLGSALGVGAGEIVALAVTIPLEELEPANSLVRVDAIELGRRLKFLEDNAVLDGHGFEVEVLGKSLEGLNTSFGDEEWSQYANGLAPSRIPIRLLAGIASYFSVNAEYLTNTAPSEASARIEAQVEFDRAVFESGARGVAARSFGTISADELRAISDVIRSIK
jgi:hypothetical protein